MIASRRTVQRLYRIVLPHDLLQKVCSFSADHALERGEGKVETDFPRASRFKLLESITFIILDGFNPK
jgi:hypothetical protein